MPEASAERDRRAELESNLEYVAQQLLELGITLHDLQPESTEVVQSKLASLTRTLQSTYKTSETLETLIPLELLDHLEEQGGNPESYIRDYMEHLAAENQFARGKLQAYQSFSKVLQGQLSKAYPEESRAYLALGGSELEEEEEDSKQENPIQENPSPSETQRILQEELSGEATQMKEEHGEMLDVEGGGEDGHVDVEVVVDVDDPPDHSKMV